MAANYLNDYLAKYGGNSGGGGESSAPSSSGNYLNDYLNKYGGGTYAPVTVESVKRNPLTSNLESKINGPADAKTRQQWINENGLVEKPEEEKPDPVQGPADASVRDSFLKRALENVVGKVTAKAKEAADKEEQAAKAGGGADARAERAESLKQSAQINKKNAAANKALQPIKESIQQAEDNPYLGYAVDDLSASAITPKAESGATPVSEQEQQEQETAAAKEAELARQRAEAANDVDDIRAERAAARRAQNFAAQNTGYDGDYAADRQRVEKAYELNMYDTTGEYAITREIRDLERKVRAYEKDHPEVKAQYESAYNPQDPNYTPDLAGAIGDTVAGATQQWAADNANAAATAVGIGNALYDASTVEQQRVANSPYAGFATDELTASNIGADASIDTEGGMRAENEANYNNLTEWGDRVAESGAEKIQNAKETRDTAIGRLAIDLTSTATQMGLDAASNLFLPGASKISLATRSFGGAAREARQDGATIWQQAGYGSIYSGAQVLSESMFDGVAKIYGAGAADDIVEGIVSKFASTDAGRTALRAALGAVGEGIEEGVNFAEPAMKGLYKGWGYVKDAYGNAENRQELAKSTLVSMGEGALLGLIGQGASVLSGQDAAKNAALRGAGTVAEPAAPASTGTEAETPTAVSAASPAAEMSIDEQIAGLAAQRDAAKAAGKGWHSLDNQIERLKSEKARQISERASEVSAPGAGPTEGMTAQEKADTISAMQASFADMQQRIQELAEQRNANRDNFKIVQACDNAIVQFQGYCDTLAVRLSQLGAPTTPAVETAPQNNLVPAQANIAENTAAPQNALASSVLSGTATTRPAAETAPTEAVEASEGATPTQAPPTTAETRTELVRELNQPSTKTNEGEGYVSPTNALLEQRANPESDLNKPTTPTERERGFSRNVRTDEAMHPELRQKYEKDPMTYEVARNKDTLNKALDVMETGVDNARATVEAALVNSQQNNQKLAPEMVPLARMVANELYEQGAPEAKAAADAITAGVAAELTAAGQLGQAAKILRNADPATAKDSLGKWIDSINEMIQKRYGNRYGWRAELTADEVALIESTDFTQKGAYEAVQKQIAKRLGKDMKSTLGEKLTEIRRINMLLKPRTMIRNVGANIPTVGIRLSDSAISGLLQGIGAKMTTLTAEEAPAAANGEYQSTLNLDGKKVTVTGRTAAECEAYAKAMKYGQTRSANARGNKQARGVAREVFETVKGQITGADVKYDSPSSILADRVVFKGTKLGAKTADALNAYIEQKTGKNPNLQASALEDARRMTYWLLEKGDTPFVRAAFEDSLASYCDVHGITDVDSVPQAAIDAAMNDAMYFTYKTQRSLTEFINKMKQKGGAFGTLVDLIQPFTGTPINIGVMVAEHNPFYAALETAKQVRLGNNAAAADAAAKGITGTAAIALGFMLRSIGAITGKADEDKDKAALDKATGTSPYAVRSPDGGYRWTYDWAAPFSTEIAFGAELSDKFAEEDFQQLMEENPALAYTQAIVQAAYASADAFIQSEMFDGVRTVFGDNNSSMSDGQYKMESALKTGLSQFIPGIANDVANIVDDKTRSTVTDKGFWGDVAANAKSRTGIGRETLPEKVNVKGEGTYRGSTWQRFLNTAINPGTKNFGERNAVDDAIYTLYEATGDKNIFPKVAPYSFTDENGEKVKMNGVENAQFQRTSSGTYYQIVQGLLDSGMLYGTTKEEAQKLFSNINSYAQYVATKELKEGRGIEYESSMWGKTEDIEDIGTYLAARSIAQTANAGFDKDKDIDYEALDYIASEVWPDASKATREALQSSYSRLGKLADAAKAGMDSETWMAYYDTFSNKDFAVKGDGTMTDMAEAWKVLIDTDKSLTPAQRSLLKEQMQYTTTTYVETATYDKMRNLGLPPEVAQNFRDKIQLDTSSGINQKEAATACLKYCSNASQAQQLWEILCPTTKTTFEKYCSKNRLAMGFNPLTR